MKKLFASILLLIYFFVSTGFVVSKHYCMDKVDSVVLGATESDKCSKCGMHTEDSSGCCRSEVKVVKLQQDQALAKLLLPQFTQAPVELPLSRHIATPFYNFTNQHESFSLRPPLISEQESYLTNCVFRI